MEGLYESSDPRLLVGFEKFDDAGVYLLREDLALVQTVDFFTPMVDHPYWFGQVAAANALSDVYAMGGRPLTAMNIVCFPACGDIEVLREILRGGIDKIREAGAVLVGGHSVDDNEPKYGLAVTGIVHPARVIRNDAVEPGDVIFLTKPLGSGIIATAIKAEMAEEAVQAECIRWMATLNHSGKEAAVAAGVRAGTDVTGFGLLGHLFEMAKGSGVAIEVYAQQLPLMTGAWEYAAMGLVPGGAYANRDYLGDKVRFTGEIDGTTKDLMYSPETSGGLLLAVKENRLEELTRQLEAAGLPVAMIGRAVSSETVRIEVKKGR